MNDPVRVVVVDDNAEIVSLATRLLQRAGFVAVGTIDPIEALLLAAEPDVDVMLSDVQMPNLTGLQLLAELRARGSTVEVVLMTGVGTIDAAVNALKSGAFDYFTKPFSDDDRLVRAIANAADKHRLRCRTQALEQMLDVKLQFEDLVGQSPKMAEVFKLVDAVAKAPSTVLLQGESGTGKELVARAIHRRSLRSSRPFVALNCSALTETLLESELFGHVKGAFTGALSSKKGLFQTASGGTLLLDEIGDMPVSIQVRLLRVLQEGEVRPVGSAESITVDVRVIAATNVDLNKAMREGRFREDLFYRLNVINIQLPPLRDRPEDIAPLVHHFIARYAKKIGKPVRGVTREAMARLLQNGWRGNVRELENVIERAIVLTPGTEITENELPADVGATTPNGDVDAASLGHLPYYQAKDLTIAAFARRYTTNVMRTAQGNITRAASLAGIERSNFRRLLKEHGVASRTEPEDLTAEDR